MPIPLGQEIAARVKTLEHQADGITHDVITRIDRTFVTPLDREDIHLLTSRLDDVIDLLDGTVRRVQMFHITTAGTHAAQLADVLKRAANQIEKAVNNLKKPKLMPAPYTPRADARGWKCHQPRPGSLALAERGFTCVTTTARHGVISGERRAEPELRAEPWRDREIWSLLLVARRTPGSRPHDPRTRGNAREPFATFIPSPTQFVGEGRRGTSRVRAPGEGPG